MSGALPIIPQVVQDTLCLAGAGKATCRFLTFGPGGWQCAKGSDLEAYLNARVVRGTLQAQGDNCSGFPEFAPKAVASAFRLPDVEVPVGTSILLQVEAKGVYMIAQGPTRYMQAYINPQVITEGVAGHAMMKDKLEQLIQKVQK